MRWNQMDPESNMNLSSPYTRYRIHDIIDFNRYLIPSYQSKLEIICDDNFVNRSDSSCSIQVGSGLILLMDFVGRALAADGQST